MEKKDYIITERELRAVPVPVETSTYKPVPHGTLIDLVIAGGIAENLQLIGEKYRASSEGKIATGYYDYRYGDDDEMGLRIAWQNSYNKQVSLKFAIGAHVFVCSNGAFFGDIGGFKKKHVGEVQTLTPTMIRDYFKTAKTTYDNLVSQKKALKEIIVTRSERAKILGDMYFNQDILKATQVEIIKKELKSATHDYCSPGTAWELYNFITFALKGVHPRDYIEIHTKVHEYFAEEFNLPQTVTKTIIDGQDSGE